MTPLELLAPARNAEIAIQAILHGADAVYMGGPSHGARAAAGNSLEDISKVVAFAHKYGARVCATLNTLVYDSELSSVERLIKDYWQVGVDALIVQDMGILRMRIPPIALHASTQCDIRTPEKALFLAKCGFNQLVLPRELTLAEIAAIREGVPSAVALEGFVHGALCVSYSGDCQASYMANGRSANRGECAQMCRMAYNLEDSTGKAILKDKHLLSLRDLNRLENLEEMALSGISSFKIEGRLKDASYVKNVVSAYRKAIDDVIAKYPERFCVSSFGKVNTTFQSDVDKAFNRGFTPYFLNKPTAELKMASINTPKSMGQPVGKVLKCQGRIIEASLSATLANGDGLGYFDATGVFTGFRLNKVEGNRLHAAADLQIPKGAILYRNKDVEWDSILSRPTAQRRIDIEMELARSTHGVSLKGTTANGHMAQVGMEVVLQKSQTPQLEHRRKTLSKLGDTIFSAKTIVDKLGDDAFISASQLADFKRRLAEALQNAIVATHKFYYRPAEDFESRFPYPELTYHDNVANSLSTAFYSSHGACIKEKALEAMDEKEKRKDQRIVMTTRYCLRRELSACLKEKNAKELPTELYISNKAARYKLIFDCKNCRMQLQTTQ